MDHVFLLCNESWHNTRLKRLYPIFNYRSFRDLHVSLSTIVHYELNFLYSSMFSLWISVLYTICWKLCSPCTDFSLHLCGKNVKIDFCISLFLGPLFCCISMFVYLVVIVKSYKQVAVFQLFFLFLSFLGILAEFYLCMNIISSLSKSYY